MHTFIFSMFGCVMYDILKFTLHSLDKKYDQPNKSGIGKVMYHLCIIIDSIYILCALYKSAAEELVNDCL